MPLSSFPTKPKYAYLDEVFALIDGVITPLVVAGYRVVVDYDTDGVTGRQRTFYNFTTISKEIIENKVFASENHLLSILKGDYLNSSYQSLGGDGTIFKTFERAENVSFNLWTDLAGLNLSEADFIISAFDKVLTGKISGTSGSAAITGVGTLFNEDASPGTVIKVGNETKTVLSVTDDTHLTLTTNLAASYTSAIFTAPIATQTVGFAYVTEGENAVATLIFDNTTLEGATLPTAIDTKAEFKSLVKSYDKDTTIWTDGNAIGI